MQIKLYGNGHSCNIPVQEIIDKYWKDETAPFSFEMSTAIGDETIAATAMLGEESPDTYPSIRLDSRNARKNSSATWFILETPNETNPYVTGYAYAGNDETESDSWITKIVDAPRGADDDSKRLVYIDDDIAETVDTKTASKLNTKYGNHCADYCATSNQLFEGKFNYEKFGKRLAANGHIEVNWPENLRDKCGLFCHTYCEVYLQTFSSCCFHDITYDKDIVDKYLARPDFYRLNISLENDCNGTSSDAYLQLTFSLKHIEFSGGYNFANLFSAEYRKDTGWFVVSGEGEVLMGTKK